MMDSRKRFALVGTGSRAGMYVEALTSTYADSSALVGLCDLSQTRMDWYNSQLAKSGLAPIPTYPAADFERMISEWVVAPPGKRRTPFSMVPSVTPVAANITLSGLASSSVV